MMSVFFTLFAQCMLYNIKNPPKGCVPTGGLLPYYIYKKGLAEFARPITNNDINQDRLLAILSLKLFGNNFLKVSDQLVSY